MENIDDIMNEKAQSVLTKLKAHKKKQMLLSGSMIAIGCVSLVAGILIAIFTSLLVGIVLVAMGASIVVAISIMNASTMKKLDKLISDANGFIVKKDDKNDTTDEETKSTENDDKMTKTAVDDTKTQD